MESLQNHTLIHPDNCAATLDQVSHIAQAQGVKSRAELVNMLHFLKAQGNLLFFPGSDQLNDLVSLLFFPGSDQLNDLVSLLFFSGSD